MDTVKQMKIASETDYFYAPLANRLGLYDIKTELENLSLKYRSPKEYLQIEDLINQYIQKRQPQIKHLTDDIKKILRKGKVTASVNTRIRTPYSVWRKMESKKAAFRELEHIYLVEIIFPSNPDSRLSEKNQILQIYSLLTDVYKERPASMMNYIDSPKDNGYQCLHCKVMGEDGNWVEIHIASENMQLNNRIGCVTGRANGVDIWVKKFREILKDIAYHGKNSGFLEDIVSTFYQDNIIVFSPRGDEIILPKNSTALDFAYEIHTNIGNHAKYARINAKLSSVKTVLKRGDRVEIGTDKSTYPHKDWLDVVSTYKAKKSILSALRKAAVEYTPLPYILCEHCCPLPGEEVIGFKKETDQIEVHKRNCPLAISLSAKAGDSIVDVVLPINKSTYYPAVILITAIDRNELLFDLSQVISKELGLYISSMHSSAKDEIVSSTIHLSVASYDELYSAMNRLEQIEGVESVKRKILFG
jgi:GTP pyrophosphokinase